MNINSTLLCRNYNYLLLETLRFLSFPVITIPLSKQVNQRAEFLHTAPVSQLFMSAGCGCSVINVLIERPSTPTPLMLFLTILK